MKHHEKSYRDPKPRTPPQLPLHSNRETKNRDGKECWPRKIKSSKMIEKPNDGIEPTTTHSRPRQCKRIFLAVFRSSCSWRMAARKCLLDSRTAEAYHCPETGFSECG